MKTYILKKDLPWAKAGTEWHEVNKESDIYMRQNGEDNERLWVRLLDLSFPAVDAWFEEKKPERWRPEANEQFFFLDFEGDILQASYSYPKTYDFGNCFRTREQCEEAARRIKATLDAYHLEIAE